MASTSLFSSAVQTVLNNWTALQLAVEHQSGGPQSREIAAWMATVVENFFKENSDVIPVEISEYIEDIMNSEFNTLCEDGSLEEVGESLCRYYRLIKTGSEAEVLQELQKFKGSAVHLCKTAPPPANGDDTSAPSSSSQPEPSPSQESRKNEPDEDGWITVTKGKK